MVEVNLVEVSKLSLGPDDVLAVKLRSDDLSEEDAADLKLKMQALFPNNKIMLMMLPTHNDLELTVITKE